MSRTPTMVQMTFPCIQLFLSLVHPQMDVSVRGWQRQPSQHTGEQVDKESGQDQTGCVHSSAPCPLCGGTTGWYGVR